MKKREFPQTAVAFYRNRRSLAFDSIAAGLAVSLPFYYALANFLSCSVRRFAMRKHKHWWLAGAWLLATAGLFWLIPQMQVARSSGDRARAPQRPNFPLPEQASEEAALGHITEAAAESGNSADALEALSDSNAGLPEAIGTSSGIGTHSASGNGLGGSGLGSLAGLGSGNSPGVGAGPKRRSDRPKTTKPKQMTTVTQMSNGRASVKRPTKKMIAKIILPSPASAEAVAKLAADDDPFAAIDRKLASLPLGSIAFNTPQSVSFGDVATIELLASLKETEAELRNAIRESGAVETGAIRLSHRMDARLTGAGFKIEAVTPDVQALSRNEQTRWLWQIEPTKTETLDLHLTLSALLTIDGEAMTRSVRTFERTIEVNVPLQSQVLAFAGQHFEWLITTLAVPLSGALYYRFRRRKRAIESETREQPLSRAA